MEKRLLLLQFGDDPVPLDLRDAVSRFKVLHQIGEHIAAFALDRKVLPRVTYIGLKTEICAEEKSHRSSHERGLMLQY